MLDVDLAFPHSYAVEEVPKFPGTGRLDGPVFYIPQPNTRPEHDGLWLRIRAGSGKTWIGVFGFGYDSPPAFSRVVSSADPHRACVISRGAAYMVKAEEPEAWEQVPIVPVLDLRLVPQYQLLILADFTTLVAYGTNGFAWRSPRVCWDELTILNVTRDTVEGVGYDPTNLGESRFAVDIRTGRSLFPSPVSANGKPLW